MPPIFSQWGGAPSLDEVKAAKDSLIGIGQTSHGGYLGSTAVEAVERYEKSGASPADVVKFAKEIGAKHGRTW